MKIIFLDIDGVLVPFGKGCKGDVFVTDCLDALAHILDNVENTTICLSSTWRAGRQHTIIKAFKQYGKKPLSLIEKFQYRTSMHKFDHRQGEICEWLEENKDDLQIDAWVALDDEELIKKDDWCDSNAKHRDTITGHVIHTVCNVGLTMADAEKAIQILNQDV